MKSPRDLLLERHRQQTPALDQLRQRVIAEELDESPAPTRDRHPAERDVPTLLARGFAWLNWQRAAWSGFAAVWCAILGLNLAAQSETEALVAATSPVDSREFLAGLQANRAQLAALLSDRNDGNAATPEAKPAPRSDVNRPRKDAFHLNSAFV